MLGERGSVLGGGGEVLIFCFGIVTLPLHGLEFCPGPQWICNALKGPVALREPESLASTLYFTPDLQGAGKLLVDSKGASQRNPSA